MYSQQPLISCFLKFESLLFVHKYIFSSFLPRNVFIDWDGNFGSANENREKKTKKVRWKLCWVYPLGEEAGSWRKSEKPLTFCFSQEMWACLLGAGGEKLRSWRKYKTKLGYWEKGLRCSHCIPTLHQQYTIKLKVNTVLPIQISDNVLLTHPATWTYSLHGLYCSIIALMPPKVSLHTIYTSKFLWLLWPVL